MAHQILAIAPYWLDFVETWVFDNEAVDLVRSLQIPINGSWMAGTSYTDLQN